MGSFDLISILAGRESGAAPEGYRKATSTSPSFWMRWPWMSTSPCTVIETVRTSPAASFAGSTLVRSVALAPSIPRIAKSAQRISSLVLSPTSTSSHVSACFVCVASSPVPNVWVANVVRSIRTCPLDCVRSLAVTSRVPAAAVVSPLMCSLTPGMSTWVELFGSTT